MQALKKKISEESMPIAWHPERWWNFCMSEDEKKEIEPNFTEWLNKCASAVSNIEVLKHFGTENMHEFSCPIFWSKCFKSI